MVTATAYIYRHTTSVHLYWLRDRIHRLNSAASSTHQAHHLLAAASLSNKLRQLIAGVVLTSVGAADANDQQRAELSPHWWPHQCTQLKRNIAFAFPLPASR